MPSGISTWALMDALRVPLKKIQERIAHALTGSFTLDVYGGKSEWEPKREAASLIATEIEKAVTTVESNRQTALAGGLSDVIASLSAIEEETHSVFSCKLLI